MGKGAWDLLVQLGTSIREHPLETAGLVLLTILFPELGLVLAAGGAAASGYRIGKLTYRLLTEERISPRRRSTRWRVSTATTSASSASASPAS